MYAGMLSVECDALETTLPEGKNEGLRRRNGRAGVSEGLVINI